MAFIEQDRSPRRDVAKHGVVMPLKMANFLEDNLGQTLQVRYRYVHNDVLQ